MKGSGWDWMKPVCQKNMAADSMRTGSAEQECQRARIYLYWVSIDIIDYWRNWNRGTVLAPPTLSEHMSEHTSQQISGRKMSMAKISNF